MMSGGLIMARRKHMEDVVLEDDSEVRQVLDAEEGRLDVEYGEEDRRGRKKRRRSQFLDVATGGDDEEEDDEDEDYGRGGRRKQRLKRLSASDFFDIEAAVDSDGDEEEEEEGEEDFIDNANDIPDEDYARQIHLRPLLPREDDDVDDLERRIRERYRKSARIEYEEDTADVDQQALLPSVRDSKLWMVKCAIGHEREAAVCLMQRCIGKGPELQIRSAIALDHLKNYIYVEADKEAHVREACKGLHNIYNTQRPLLVPINERTDVLSVESKAIAISRGTWVRMMTGTYKGDLAKVVEVDNVKHRVTVKLIPRVDLQAIAKKMGNRETPKKKSFFPSPHFLNVDEARELNIRVDRRPDPVTSEYFETIGDMKFKDGFLHKVVSTKSISTQDVKPSFEELENFRSGGVDSCGPPTVFAKTKNCPFKNGDTVIAVKGDLKSLKGRVEKVDGETVYIRPGMRELPKTVAVNQKELRKYFEPGNHVKVVSGRQEGVTGTVVKVEQHTVIILSDTTMEHIHAFADDVVETTEGGLLSRLSNLRPFKIPASPRRFHRGGSSMNRPVGGRRGGGRGQNPGLSGTTVTIRKGPFKGYRGRVMEVKGQSVRVELESQMKVVTVDRDVISDNVACTRHGESRETTPMHPSRTPLRPLMTPMRDADPGATPIHDVMRTPMLDRAWLPMSSNNPMSAYCF